MSASPHLVLVDGSGFIFRAFHALPPMRNPAGVPVNAVYGFTTMLQRLLREHVGTHLAIIFDAGRHSFRNDLYPLYKAHRPEAPEDLRPQFSLIRDATRAFGVPLIEIAGWEADDIIASYAEVIGHKGGRCTIVSSDKDLMQLVTERVKLLDPLKNKKIDFAEVEAKFGVPPAQVVDVQALMGDSSDNVPGVPGIGPKGAADLVKEFGTLDAVLAAAPNMKESKRQRALIEHADAARLSLQLVKLAKDVPLPESFETLILREPDNDHLRDWLELMGFHSLLQRVGIKRERSADRSLPSRHDAPSSSPCQPAYGPYITIRTQTDLEAWCARARQSGYVAVDTETDSLIARQAKLIGLSLAVAPGQAAYIPVRHEGTLEAPTGEQLTAECVLEIMSPLFADPSVLKIFQNAKYDLHVLANAGVESLAPIDDTMLLSYAQAAGAHAHGMDELARLHLGHEPLTYNAVTGTGRARIQFAHVTVERATAYAAEDADVTLRLWHILRPALRARQSLVVYETIERRLIPILLEMEQRGVKVDTAELRRMSVDFGARMAAMEADIHKSVGRSFNLGSPKQLGEILFDEMKLAGGKRTKAGAWGTDSSVLQELSDLGHELPAKILAWRQLAKLKSTYADALLEQMDQRTGRVHTSFQMAITTTGRLSSNEPNLQNIPIRTEEGARIRRAFVAETGHVLLSADYSQIELRLLASVADIETLKQAFALGQDIHARTASEVFDVPLEGMDSLTRRRAKAINFGIIYGISAFGLARQLGISAGEARRYIDTYFERYPGIRAYMDRVKGEAEAHGFVTTPFGRRCYVPGIADRNGAKRRYAERQAINAPLQGGAADIIKKAMVRIARRLKEERLDARMLLQVHDELLFEVESHSVDKLAALVRAEMEQAERLDVPLVVEVQSGRNWAEAH